MTSADQPSKQRVLSPTESAQRPRRSRVRRLSLERLERRDLLSVSPPIRLAMPTDGLVELSPVGEQLLVAAPAPTARDAPGSENHVAVSTATAGGNGLPDIVDPTSGPENRDSSDDLATPPPVVFLAAGETWVCHVIRTGTPAELRPAESAGAHPVEIPDGNGNATADFLAVSRPAVADDRADQDCTLIVPAQAMADGDSSVGTVGRFFTLHLAASQALVQFPAAWVVSADWANPRDPGTALNRFAVGDGRMAGGNFEFVLGTGEVEDFGDRPGAIRLISDGHEVQSAPSPAPALRPTDITDLPLIPARGVAAKAPTGPQLFQSDLNQRSPVAPGITGGATRSGYFVDDGVRPRLGWTIERDAARSEFQAFSVLRPLASGLSDLGRSDARDRSGDRAVGWPALRRVASSAPETDGESARSRVTKARNLRARDAVYREIEESSSSRTGNE